VDEGGEVTLWPHQVAVLAEARAAAARLMAAGNAAPGILIQLPTGAGKTRVGLEAVRVHLAAGKHHTAVWFAHREELVDQPIARLAAEGVDVGVVALRPGTPWDHRARIHVCSIQTWCARAKAGTVEPATLAVFDEARHYTAAMWGAAGDHYRSAIRIGLDATPCRLDGAPLSGLFDVLVQGPQVSALVEAGYLVPSVIIGPDSYQEELADDPVERWLRDAPGLRTVMFCASVSHAATTAAAFRARGIPAECIEGATARRHRSGALSRLAAGATKVVTNVFCLTEGTDVPEVECVAVARGCSSEAAWVQMLGRGARLSPSTGKTRLTVLDFRGHVHRHGPLDADRTYHLEGRGLRRVLEPLAAVSQCRQCLGWSRPASKCPACGAMTPPPRAPRITKREMREQRLARVPKAGAGWELWCRLVQTQRERSYKPQWAAIQYRQLSGGQWPRWTVASVPEERTAANG
jgi:DNA repair protein RadD